MNYLNHYKLLITKSKNRTIDKNLYYEKHHIIPKSIQNNTFAYNLLSDIGNINETVYLLYREHLIAHLLLVKIFESKSIYHNKDCYLKMSHSSWFMLNVKNGKNILNNKQYNTFRMNYIKNANSGKNAPMYKKNHMMIWTKKYGIEKANELNKIKIEKTKNFWNIPENKQRRLDIAKAKMTDDVKNKIRLKNTGRIFTDNHRKKISESIKKSHINNPLLIIKIKQSLKNYYLTHENHFKNCKHSEESLSKIRNRKHTIEEKLKMSQNHYDCSKENNSDATKYIIQTPNNEIIEIITRENVRKLLNCKSNIFFDKKFYKGYTLINKIKINYKNINVNESKEINI